MDGGGRFLQPMTAYQAGVGSARAPSYSKARSNPLRPSRFAFRFRRITPALGPFPIPWRASSAAFPRHRSRARLLLHSSPASASPIGGHLDPFYRQLRRAPPCARAHGRSRIERITISGIAQLRESEVLAAAGITPKTFAPVPRCRPMMRERLERMPMIKSASVRKLYPDELVVTLIEREPMRCGSATASSSSSPPTEP